MTGFKRMMVGVMLLALPLTACQGGEQEAEVPGGGAGYQNSPIPGVPPTQLGDSYQKAYVSMANAYMEILQQDYDGALPHARAAQAELNRIRAMGGEVIPETIARDVDDAEEIVAMIQERNQAVAKRTQDFMVSMTEEASSLDLARPDGAGGGAGTTERKTEGPAVAQPEPSPGSKPQREPQSAPNPNR